MEDVARPPAPCCPCGLPPAAPAAHSTPGPPACVCREDDVYMNDLEKRGIIPKAYPWADAQDEQAMFDAVAVRGLGRAGAACCVTAAGGWGGGLARVRRRALLCGLGAPPGCGMRLGRGLAGRHEGVSEGGRVRLWLNPAWVAWLQNREVDALVLDSYVLDWNAASVSGLEGRRHVAAPALHRCCAAGRPGDGACMGEG